MNDSWQKIWNEKGIDPGSELNLQTLIELDGFASPFGGLHDADSWTDYVKRIENTLKIQKGDSIFEVGCGAGAFLYYFYKQGNEVSGLDYSEALVKIANLAMPNALIKRAEAHKLDTAIKFDFIVSNGVFIYFPNYDYAANILKKMLLKCKRSIGIFDVPDLAKKEENLMKRKALLGEAEYNRMYKGLDHLYFSKNWFHEILSSELVKIRIEDQFIENYGNSDYRFNVFIEKK